MQRKTGFTLIEILVVLGIAAILSSITFGAFRSISNGNKQTSCQSNLSQIYKSCRLYAQDYDGRFPYLNLDVNANNADNAPIGGIGLWALYTFPNSTNNNCSKTDFDLRPLDDSYSNSASVTGYVRSAKIFHCPNDNFEKVVQYRDVSSSSCTSATTRSNILSIPSGNATYLNPSYLSYQLKDDIGPSPQFTYSSFRKNGETNQLIYFLGANTPERPVEDKTVVTWCRYHRSLSGDGTQTKGQNNRDNVLFYDGTVQSLPTSEDGADFPGCTSSPCEGWQRVPKSVR